ncbi:MAG TPA: cytochrome P450 [Intrasporangium sp.]|uniref:cytochrome P450 n=1 Tax=Intrasporangium sp. TaxID=1925024 RepID=UPI002B46E8F9|nr:cytochrome P450 [Intrasporangium sp.]HKX66590.1 cytochrome P450 [Intrasporangium sp.]
MTTALLRDSVDGRPLTDAEIVSIVRNWTVGELGTIAASIGIVVEFLARRPDVVELLRDDPGATGTATDEILRIHAPLVANRRGTRRSVTIRGRRIQEDERVIVLWASANRDERVFGDPDEFRLDRDPGDNLLYGRGIHDCPGAPLARLELRVVVEALLATFPALALPAGGRRELGRYPGSGFSVLDVRLA